MTEKTLERMRVAILATNGVQETELAAPRKALEEAGARTTLIAPQAGTIQASKHGEKTIEFPVEVTFDSVNPADFDAVLLPGGVLNADALRGEPKAQEFVREIDKAGKPIAVICHGPWLLISAGLTKGRTMTSYHTIRDDVRNSGANYLQTRFKVSRPLKGAAFADPPDTRKASELPWHLYHAAAAADPEHQQSDEEREIAGSG
jgi:protease I